MTEGGRPTQGTCPCIHDLHLAPTGHGHLYNSSGKVSQRHGEMHSGEDKPAMGLLLGVCWRMPKVRLCC
jgi:hypothetical protein